MQGETVPYIICVERSEDGQVKEQQSKGLAERAFHPEEVNGNPNLAVDANYYLANQVCNIVFPESRFLGIAAFQCSKSQSSKMQCIQAFGMTSQ